MVEDTSIDWSRAPLPGERKPRRGDVLEAELHGFDAKGRALGTCGEYRVELRGGVPGARVRAEVTKRRGQRIRARLLEVLVESPEAVDARCEHFGTCGGCTLQALDYGVQLEHLREHVSGAFAAEGLADVAVERVLPCDDPWAYRNKMDFTFGTQRWVVVGEQGDKPRDFALGLHVGGLYRKVVDIDACPIQFAGADEILADVRRLCRAQGLVPWDVVEHTGLLRHVVLRKGMATGEIMVLLVTATEAAAEIQPLVAELVRLHPEITTVVQGIHGRAAAVATGDQYLNLHGAGFIHDQLGGLIFRLSAASFFQTNTAQAERLFEVVINAARLTGSEQVLDLYCGTGVISLLLAGRARQVVGLELVEEAVRDARLNAQANDIHNVSFLAGDVLVALLDPQTAAPDVIVVDPPRAGLHPKVIPAILERAPRRLVYVSCNAKSAARDAALLVAGGYHPGPIQPVDLFPHTPHVECVFSFESGGPRLGQAPMS
ncbi:MAG: 23S rRNA (uracil(1939)-C(5))-methyltransferase RlmD [Planctomycetota bacterium]|jgi:23S rRNA (uracil1939-C5)-methyltransferase|nr:23S rRNA (uracil(1939)-C(5))-methyltransferase RlmD [Planctomycetota bacterium]MDP6838191.1 23S rRNA (uracil(1939)-C(5))-methyltransferase RlmD [Planctomycetota bacterium]